MYHAHLEKSITSEIWTEIAKFHIVHHYLTGIYWLHLRGHWQGRQLCKVPCLLSAEYILIATEKEEELTCLLLMVSFSRKCRRTVDGSSIRQFHKTCWATALTLEEKRNGHTSINKKKVFKQFSKLWWVLSPFKGFLKLKFFYHVSVRDLTAELPDKWYLRIMVAIREIDHFLIQVIPQDGIVLWSTPHE